MFVDDVVAVNLWFLQHPEQSGIFNLGTGRAQPFNDVAVAAVNTARTLKGEAALPLAELLRHGLVEYIAFPDALVGKYQCFTQADLSRLRATGCDHRFADVASRCATLRGVARRERLKWRAPVGGGTSGAPPEGDFREPPGPEESVPSLQSRSSTTFQEPHHDQVHHHHPAHVPAHPGQRHGVRRGRCQQGDQAELEAVKGIGPSMATRILDARKASPFKDWTDLADRVKGVGPGNAAKFSAEGMTVAGAPYTAAPAAAAKLPRKAAQVPDTKK